MKKIIYTEKAPKAIGPYSQAILANGVLYCSGQIALDASSGEFLNGDVKAQTEKSIENIVAVLDEAGLTLDNIVKTTCFLTDMNDFADFNSVYEKYFLTKPARSCVAAKELPKGALVEIEVVAACSSL